jgi:hypothetical protein
MSSVASGPAAPSPTRPWPAARVEHWPIRAVDTLCEQSAASQRGRPRQDRRIHSQMGGTNPVLVDANGVLIAGHGRVAAARKLRLSPSR